MAVNFLLGVCLLFCLMEVISCDFEPTVKTEYGTYSGHIMKARNGRDILAWKGIPFAKPPLGNLRFKVPQKLEKNNVVVEAANYSERCFQQHFNFNKQNTEPEPPIYLGNEDCLYLNVFKPKVDSNKGPLPVLVYIHGGGYFLGSSADCSPSVYLEKDMIMVTMNYRLSILGFLSANDDTIPGNLGLKDQAMALKWVQENIAAFGGDPNLVTIAGMSAGASSVSQHLNSKLTKGMFARAIAHSGNAGCGFATSTKKEAREYASKIISYLGCSNEPQKLLTCLQKMPVKELFEAARSIKIFRDETLEMKWVPVIEDDSPTAFMTSESVKEGSQVPFLTGVCSEEGIIIYYQLSIFEKGFYDLSILNTDYKKLLPLLGYYYTNPRSDEISERVRQFYFGDGEITEESVSSFVNMLSDMTFNLGLHIDAKNHKGKVYQFLFSYLSNFTYIQSKLSNAHLFKEKVNHAEDGFFYFPWGEMTETNLEMSHLLLDMMYNFVITGDPTPEKKIWEESEGGVKYLDITNDGLLMRKHMFKERMEFLDNLLLSKLGHDEL